MLHDDQDQLRAVHDHHVDHALTFDDVLAARAGGPRLMTEVALTRARQICSDVAIITAGPGLDLWAWFTADAHEVSHVQRIVGHAWGATWSFLAVRPPCRPWVRHAVWHLDGLPALFVGEESDEKAIIVHDCLDELLPSFAADCVVTSMARALDLRTLWFQMAASTEEEEGLAARFEPQHVSEADLDRVRRRVRWAQDRSDPGSSAPSGASEK